MRKYLIISFNKLLITKSMHTRITISLFSSVCKSGLNFLAALLLARHLDSAGYGELMFLFGSFNAIRSLMDLGAGNAFFTFISQEKKPETHYHIYFCWLLIQLLLLAIFIVLSSDSILELIWVNSSRDILIVAMVAFFLQQQGWQTISQIGESQRKTVLTQLLGSGIALINVIGIFFIGTVGQLTLMNILVFYIIEYTLMLAIGFVILDIKRSLVFYGFGIKAIKDVLNQYVQYCYPLVIITIVSSFYNYVDTWALQYFAGSRQQGLFQVANQISMISLVAMSAILNIFWKEIAHAYGQNDDEKLKLIYSKAMRGGVMLGAIISGFFVPWINQITQILLGSSYSDAVPVLAIMIYYPIHQAMGQVTATFFLATQKTKAYSRISIVFMLLSIPMTYIIQAPKVGVLVPGLELGAIGLALKIVFINIVSVNCCAYIIAKSQNWKYDYTHQIYACILTGVIGYAAYFLSCFVADFVSLDSIIHIIQGGERLCYLCFRHSFNFIL